MPSHVPSLVVEPVAAEESWRSTHRLAWRDARGAVVARGARDEDRSELHFPGYATFRFRSPVREIQAIPKLQTDREVLEDVAWRTALPLALAASGVPVLHAAAVRGAEGVVGLCAASGTGKSTLAAALGCRGAPPWADDALAFEVEGDGVRALPLPFRLQTSEVPADPVSRSAAEARRTEPVPLAALCILERTPRLATPQWLRLPATVAFPSLLSHAYAFDPNDPGEMGSTAIGCLDLCRVVPIFRLRFSPGLSAPPELAARVASEIPGLRGTIRATQR